VAKLAGRHVLAANKPVHCLLVARAGVLDHDVDRGPGKSGIANQRDDQRVTALVAVNFSVAQSDDAVCAEYVEDRGDRLDRPRTL